MLYERDVMSWMLILWTITLGRSSRTESIFAGNWCTHNGAVTIVGDFNGNQYDDVMCNDDHGRNWKIDDGVFAQGRIAEKCLKPPEESSSQYLEGMNEFCMLTHQARHIGDFNGDGADDILCHNRLTAKSEIALSDSQGFFTGVSWTSPIGWCGITGKIVVGDFNGDKKADLLCNTLVNGYKHISFARPGSYFAHGTDWQLNMQWCPSERIYASDFNGDEVDDLLCRSASGQIWIAYAKKEVSAFTGFLQGYYKDSSWCNHAGSVFKIGHMNNDLYADLLCYDSDGDTLVQLNHPTLRFNSLHQTFLKFCPGNVNHLLVGYFTNSSYQQLMCTTAPEWRILSDFV